MSNKIDTITYEELNIINCNQLKRTKKNGKNYPKVTISAKTVIKTKIPFYFHL